MKKIISIFMVFLVISSTLYGGLWFIPGVSAQAPPHTMWGLVRIHNGSSAGPGLTVNLYNTNKSRLYSDITDSNGIWLISLDDYNDGNILEIDTSYINMTFNVSKDRIIEIVAGSPGTQQATDLLLNIPPTITLVAPINNSSVPDATPTLLWDSSDWDYDPSDVLTHTLYLDTADTFDSGNLRIYYPGTSESFTIPTSLISTRWYWKVNVDDSYIGYEINSSVRDFIVNLTTPTNPYNITTYNYTNGTTWAFGFEVNNFGECTDVNPNVELNASQYTQIESDDNTYLDSFDPGGGDEAALRFKIKVNDTISDITLIAITFMGYGATSSPIELYIYNYATSGYEYLNDQGTMSEFTMTGEVTNDFSDYFDGGGNLTFLLYYTDTDDQFYTDYVQLDIYNWTTRDMLK